MLKFNPFQKNEVMYLNFFGGGASFLKKKMPFMVYTSAIRIQSERGTGECGAGQRFAASF